MSPVFVATGGGITSAWQSFQSSALWGIIHPLLMVVMAIIFFIELFKFGLDTVKGQHRVHFVRVLVMALIMMFLIAPGTTFIPFVSGLESIVTKLIKSISSL